MTGTAKFKDDSKYRYRGLTLPIIGVYEHHTDKEMNDIYPVGSVTYKLSLEGTEWSEQTYTVIHDSELEDIKTEGSLEATLWYDRLKKEGQKVINELFNSDIANPKTIDEIYQAFNNAKPKTYTFGVYDGECNASFSINLEKKDKILERIVDYMEVNDCTSGESLHQDDNCIIYAPDVLSNIIDDILEVKTEWDDD